MALSFLVLGSPMGLRATVGAGAQLWARSTTSLRAGLIPARALAQEARDAGHDVLALADRGFAAGLDAFVAGCEEAKVAGAFGVELDLKGSGDATVLVLARDRQGIEQVVRLSSAHAQPYPGRTGAVCARTLDEADRTVRVVSAGAPGEACEVAHAQAVRLDADDRTLGEALDARRHHPPLVGVWPWWAPARTPADAVASLEALRRTTTHEHEYARLWPGAGRPVRAEDADAWPEPRRSLWRAAGALVREYAWLASEADLAPPARHEVASADDDVLGERARAALAARGLANDERYAKRLEHELQVIRSLGYAATFLEVAALMQWAREERIRTGPGRGSAASSLVAWTLAITHPDPVRAELDFARFLGRERASPPDFDLDVPPDAQGKVQRRLKAQWDQRRGTPASAHCATWVRWKERSALHAAAHVRGVPRPVAERWLDEARRKELTSLDRTACERAAADAEWLQGASSAVSRHPGAVALLPGPLEHYATVLREDDQVCLQDDHDQAEAKGAIKVDVLAIEALSVIGRVAEEDEDPWDLPRCEKVWRALGEGFGTGVFQLEGHGIQRALRRLAPASIAELRDIVAMYRPGPIDSLETYCRGDAGHGRSHALAEALEPILGETRGVLLYQEQASRIAVECGGLDTAEGYRLQKAISKKDPGLIATLRERFLAGAREASPKLSEVEREELWALLERQAGYSFNRAHATCYAQVGYACAWYRENRTHATLAAMADAALAKPDDRHAYLQVRLEAARRAVPWHTPDWFASGAHHRVEDDAVRAPLHVLRHVGRGIEGLGGDRHAPREAAQVLERLRALGANRSQVRALLEGGAFDALDERERERLATPQANVPEAVRALLDPPVETLPGAHVRERWGLSHPLLLDVARARRVPRADVAVLVVDRHADQVRLADATGCLDRLAVPDPASDVLRIGRAVAVRLRHTGDRVEIVKARPLREYAAQGEVVCWVRAAPELGVSRRWWEPVARTLEAHRPGSARVVVDFSAPDARRHRLTSRWWVRADPRTCEEVERSVPSVRCELVRPPQTAQKGSDT